MYRSEALEIEVRLLLEIDNRSGTSGPVRFDMTASGTETDH